jgi:hypothetical protein
MAFFVLQQKAQQPRKHSDQEEAKRIVAHARKFREEHGQKHGVQQEPNDGFGFA